MERLLPRNVQAVIFDMDGLMVDTERLDLEHFRRAAADLGHPEAERVFLQTVGRNRSDTRKHFHSILGEDFPFDQIRDRWRRYSKIHSDEFGVPLKPGLPALLTLLSRLALPKAVATSTQKQNALELLEKLELLHHFKTVVGGDEVSSGKPNPEIFLTAAERLRVEPANCVVFEDSPAGISAAHAAGMIPILVPDLIAPPKETLDISYRVLTSLEEAPDLFAGF